MVRPLTKRTKKGVLYVRPQAVETAIRAALREDWATLRRRLEITDSRSPEHLSSECLVHLFRDAHRKGDDRRMSAILPVLLGRCEAILKTTIVESEPGASEMREEVLGRFTEVLARGCAGERPDELDFYECRFNRAFRALRVDVVNHKRRRLRRTVEVPRGGDGDEPLLSEEEGLALLSEAGRTPATQEQSARLNDVKEAIEALPIDERKAFVLCRVYGYPEVVDRPLRRRFSPSYKLRIVEEADRSPSPARWVKSCGERACTRAPDTWRKAAHGSLKALSKKRGRKPERNPLDEKVRKLERRNARLETRRHAKN